jgi:hypothetical protein
MALAVKVSAKHPYSGEDEIVDRLAFLATELGLDQSESKSGATVAALATRRIKRRDFTRLINPGLLPDLEEGDTGGPWEIHALSHHSRLMVANLEEYDAGVLTIREQWTEEVEKFRSKFCEFLTSEATLVPCWERINLTARRGWLHSEATSVLASTLLEICQKDIGIAPKGKGIGEGKDPRKEEEIRHDTTARSAHAIFEGRMQTEPENSLSAMADSPTKRRSTFRQSSQGARRRDTIYRASVLGDQLSVESLLAMQLAALERLTGATGLPPPIEWTQFRPPIRYHPEDFFNSLDDTPNRYKRPDIDNVRIPVAILNALSPPDKTNEAANHLLSSACVREAPYRPSNLTISDIRDSDVVKWVSVVDIKALARKAWPMTAPVNQTSQYDVEVAGRLRNAPKIDDLSNPDEQEKDRQFDEDDNERLVTALSDSVGESSSCQVLLADLF